MTECSVVITGAAGGIGRSLCETFSRQGWWVVATDTVGTCDAQCESYTHLDIARMCMDPEYAYDRITSIRDAIPGNSLNALINNAAVQTAATFEELGMEEWRQTIDTNLLGPAFLVRELLRELEAAHGTVVNIASIHARLTKPRFSAYATSKAGLIGLTRSLAVELGGRVRVNAICPAAIHTDMLNDGLCSQNLEPVARCHPSGVLGSTDDVAKAALYLVDPDCQFLTGAILGVDGAIGSRLHDPE